MKSFLSNLLGVLLFILLIPIKVLGFLIKNFKFTCFIFSILGIAFFFIGNYKLTIFSVLLLSQGTYLQLLIKKSRFGFKL